MRAEQALEERPDDEALARRLVQLAGHRGAAAVRDRLRVRAAGATSYAPCAAYAQLLLALGDAPAAATAFGEALRLSPEAPAALAGRARALRQRARRTRSARTTRRSGTSRDHRRGGA